MWFVELPADHGHTASDPVTLEIGQLEKGDILGWI
jgi:hypothetical protein